MTDRLFTFIIWFAVVLVTSVLCWMLGEVILKGLSHLSWSFLRDAPRQAGRAGGIAPILLSTGLILAVALSVALPFGLAVAVWLAEFS
ncbi:MAG: hypothetical protein P8144_12870 [Gammaproteobacteria bacterium]